MIDKKNSKPFHIIDFSIYAVKPVNWEQMSLAERLDFVIKKGLTEEQISSVCGCKDILLDDGTGKFFIMKIMRSPEVCDYILLNHVIFLKSTIYKVEPFITKKIVIPEKSSYEKESICFDERYFSEKNASPKEVPNKELEKMNQVLEVVEPNFFIILYDIFDLILLFFFLIIFFYFFFFKFLNKLFNK
jgi:hypothetical protein